jgi:hypothetical protein
MTYNWFTDLSEVIGGSILLGYQTNWKIGVAVALIAYGTMSRRR